MKFNPINDLRKKTMGKERSSLSIKDSTSDLTIGPAPFKFRQSIASAEMFSVMVFVKLNAIPDNVSLMVGIVYKR